MTYDTTNIFARILRKEIPTDVLYENNAALAFHDISPAAPVHVLIISKYPAASYDDFVTHAPDADITAFFKTVAHIASMLGVVDGGYRLITNHGKHASQTVAHFHVHLLAGKALGRLLPDA
jgi:diadenosine tetraphosphate (Ap4A) HIT family hydrolase